MRRLPPDISTLYAELLEQLTIVDARRTIGYGAGSFVTKTIKGNEYLFFQHAAPGGVLKQQYIGRVTPALETLVRQFNAGRADVADDHASIERLCALLRLGGAAVTDTGSARVITALADAAVFRLGGMLVGTQAFIIMNNMLGVRWADGMLRTDDVDVAGEHTLAIAVPELRADIPTALEALAMGFLPVPGLSPKSPSTSFKVRGKSLRVDLLTPATGAARKSGEPVFLARFGAAAEPLRFLDYLLEAPQPAALIDGAGVLVSVPQPARFAMHKLLVARSRPSAFQAKAEKDLRQAAYLIEVLRQDRPGDLRLAVEAIDARGQAWRKAFDEGIALLARRDPDAAEHVRALRIHRRSRVRRT